jgi:hypothetical protein
MEDARPNAAVVLGIVTLMYSASHIVFPGLLPPLAPVPAMEPVERPSRLDTAVPWETLLKELMGKNYRPPAERDAALRTAVVIAVVAQWAVVAVGVTTAALLILRRRPGRMLAVGLYTVIFGSTLFARWQLVRDAGWGTSLRLWRMMAQVSPRWAGSIVLDLTLSAVVLAYLVHSALADRRTSVARAHS